MSDPLDLSDRRGTSLTDYLLYLIAVAGLAWAIASVWLGMRAVMDLGGFCASGGPYQVRVECPDGVGLIMFLAFPLGFLSAGVMVWKGVRIGGGYAGLVGLAWPALFLSLGFNFLQYAFAPPDGSGEVVWGWLIPGVLFMLMGGFPLLGWLGTRDETSVLPGTGSRPTPKTYAQLARALREAVRLRAAENAAPAGGTSAVRLETTGGLVAQLERLATLHRGGALTDQEYESAKSALIGAASRGELGWSAERWPFPGAARDGASAASALVRCAGRAGRGRGRGLRVLVLWGHQLTRLAACVPVAPGGSCQTFTRWLLRES